MWRRSLRDLPEKASVIQPVLALFEKAFTACSLVFEFAFKTTSTEGLLKAATRLKAECVPAYDETARARFAGRRKRAGIREVKTASAAEVGYFAAVQVNQRQQIDIVARGVPRLSA